MPETLADFKRFADLIAPMIASPPPFVPNAENVASVQVERGVVFAHSMNDPADAQPALVERLIETATHRVAFVDRHGHTRPVYQPLAIYCWLQTFSRAYESLPRTVRPMGEARCRAGAICLEHSLGGFAWPGEQMPAHWVRASDIAWIALALHCAGKIFIRDAWTDLAADTFGRFTKRQRSDGAFLATTNSDNPETTWYHELVLLHAAASYAVQAEDRAAWQPRSGVPPSITPPTRSPITRRINRGRCSRSSGTNRRGHWLNKCCTLARRNRLARITSR